MSPYTSWRSCQDNAVVRSPYASWRPCQDNAVVRSPYASRYQSLKRDQSAFLWPVDPNYEGGWPIRQAARCGSYSVVKTLLQYRANPHILGDSGASTLQLAVFSNKHWETDRWSFLLSCCDSSQLADGAAVAIVFHNIAAIKAILQTGRCNTNIPTTLTGKTVEQLAKGYQLDSVLNVPVIHNVLTTPQPSPRVSRYDRTNARATATSEPHHRNLSPSVARFFDQTAGQTMLTVQRSPVLLVSSPTNEQA